MVCIVSGVLFQGLDVCTLGNTLSRYVTQDHRVARCLKRLLLSTPLYVCGCGLSVFTMLGSLPGQTRTRGEWDSGQWDYTLGTAVTALLCGCSVIKLNFYFRILALANMDSPVFTLTRVYSSPHNSTNNHRTPPYYGHASSLHSSISKVLTILKWVDGHGVK